MNADPQQRQTEAIMGRLGHGPSTLADLACEVHKAGVKIEDMYRITIIHMDALVKRGGVEYLRDIAAYRLSENANFEKEDDK